MWVEIDEFKYAKYWNTKLVRGSVKIVDGNNKVVKSDNELEKISTSAWNVRISSGGNSIYFADGNYDLYYRDLSKSDNDKIASGDINHIQISEDGKIITYLYEYNHIEEKGELYFIKEGESPKNIASDVRSYKLSNNSEEVYYLNQEKNLILVDLDSDEEDRVKEEISDNITKWNLMSNHIIYLTEDKELYIKELGKEKEKML